MVKLLLAGTGLIGHRHMQHILEHPDFELVGIIDPIISDKKIEGIKTYSSLNDVNTVAEGIILATPTDTHADLTIKSLEMGMHVLVEKPVAASLLEAYKMILDSKKKCFNVLFGHHLRHHQYHLLIPIPSLIPILILILKIRRQAQLVFDFDVHVVQLLLPNPFHYY